MRGIHHISHAIFLQIYAGCRTYLYGHLEIIHLFVRFDALSQSATEAQAYIPMSMSILILRERWIIGFPNCGKSVECHPTRFVR